MTRTLVRPCLGCAKPVRGKTRCVDCQTNYDRGKRQRRPDLDDRAERRRRQRLVAEHRATIGDWCGGVPELGRGAHPTADLTADHLHEVALGGDPHGALVVRCRSCNAARSAHLASGLFGAAAQTTRRQPEFPTLFATGTFGQGEDGPVVA